MLWGNTGTKRKSPFGLPDVMTPGGGYGGGMPAGNPGAPMPEPAAQARKGDKTRRIIGLASEALGGLLGNGPGLYAKSVLQRQETEQEAAQYERRRADAYADWEKRQRFKMDNPDPGNPYRFEDNAGNVYERGPDGQNRLIFTDPNDKVFMQDGQMITVPNRVRGQSSVAPGVGSAAAEGSTATNPATGEKVQFRGGQWVPMGGQPAQGQRPFDVNEKWSNGVLTSGRRTPEGNRLVGGVPDSAHLRGDAFDLDGPNLGALRSEAQARYPDAKILVHDGHVHVQKPGLNVPFYGKRGTRGLRK